MSCNCNNNNFSNDGNFRQITRPLTNGCEPIHCPPAQCFCCTGMQAPKFNAADAQSIFANIQQVFDSKVVSGCSINQPLNLTPTGCSIITEYTPCGGSGCCCSTDPCIDENSCFLIQSYSASILDAFPTTMPSAGEILINNVPFNGPVNVINRNKFSIALEDLNENSLNVFCQEEREGSKVAVVVEPSGTTVNFIAEYILCGTVTTSRGAFSFKMLIRNANFDTTVHPTNIFTNDICIPFLSCQDTGLMTFDYCYDAQLIAPQIIANENGELSLTGTLIINPHNTIETLIDKRVLLNVIEPGNDCDKKEEPCKDKCKDKCNDNNGCNCNCNRR